jgi:hypothetical protein
MSTSNLAVADTGGYFRSTPTADAALANEGMDRHFNALRTQSWRTTTRRLQAVPELDISAARPSAQPTMLPKESLQEQVSTQLLAEWHGQVTEVLASSFIAELKGRHGEGVAGKEEVAVIPRDEVSPDDAELLEPGAFFSLCIAYEQSSRGRRKFTTVVFRRLPAYRREELEEARERGRQIARGLRLE